MCQKVSCYPLKPLYPSCLQAIPALAWRENRLQSLAMFSYNGARFLDETDKKVFYKQGSSRGWTEKAAPGVVDQSAACLYLFVSFTH